MKLSKIKLLDLISNAPRSNKKKYIKNGGNNSGGAIKVDSIEHVDANDYEPGTIVVDKFSRPFVCQLSYVLYEDPDETLQEIFDEEPEYSSAIDDTFVVDGIQYRRWYETDGQTTDKHYIIITKEKYVKSAYSDLTPGDKIRFSPFIRAIAAGQYNATLEDETTLDYIGADETSKTIFGGTVDEENYYAWTIRAFGVYDIENGVIKDSLSENSDIDYCHVVRCTKVAFGESDSICTATLISDRDLQEVPELISTEDTIFFDFNFECKRLIDVDYVFIEKINSIKYSNANTSSTNQYIIAKKTCKVWKQLFLI